MNLQRLLYVSRCVVPLDSTALKRLLGSAQVNNRRSDITGALAFTGRHFVQLLEGDEQALGRLLQRLEADSRHADVQVIQRVRIQRRLFSEWAMNHASCPGFEADVEQLLAAGRSQEANAGWFTLRLLDVLRSQDDGTGSPPGNP